jgi:serine/threonine-protein kinase
VKGYSIHKGIGLAISLWLAAGHGVAEAQTAADKAAADTLFNEGKKQIAQGDPAAACALFEASLAKAVQLGAQLALASCYETVGKTASAWGEFRAAASTAAKAHDRRQRFAEDHAAALEPRLSRLVLRTEPGYRVDGLEIKRDGAVISAAELGEPVPVDPGDHTIEASAPGWVAWSNKVTVALPGVVEVIVPALGKAPVKVEEPKAEPAPVAATPPPEEAVRGRRLLAYGIGGGGAGLIGVSLIFGAVASSRWGDAQNHCRHNQCDAAGVDLAHGAQSMGNISTAMFIVGAAALATGVILYVTAHPSNAEKTPDPTALRILPGSAAAPVGLTLQGGF